MHTRLVCTILIFSRRIADAHEAEEPRGSQTSSSQVVASLGNKVLCDLDFRKELQ